MYRMLAAGTLLGAACSSLPSREWPAHDERQVTVTIAANGRPIELPVSGPSLSIFSLTIEPRPQRERFRAGRRWIEPPAGCKTVTVRCHYRAYGTPPPPPTALFPDASKIRTRSTAAGGNQDS